MDPLLWIRTRFAEISGLPGRLQRIADEAHEVLRDRSRSAEERTRAGQVWAGAIADRAEVARILNINIRPYTSPTMALSALPLLAIYGTTAAVLVATLTVLFSRATTYERELRALASGNVTATELERLRDDAPQGGVAGTIHEATKLLTLAAVVGAGVYALKRWDKK